MHALVYIFIALAVLGIAAAAFFGLTFSPVEALVVAIAFGAVVMLLVERSVRRRTEDRLERGIEDLTRLLSSDAQTEQELSQRVAQLADANAQSRLDAIEADISVLGAVVRQVADSVAEIEENQHRTGAPAANPRPVASGPAEPAATAEPAIPLELLKQALAENRMVCHIEPIVELPMRRPAGYDVVPRLLLEDGEVADPVDYMPRRGSPELIRQIEALALDEAITIARRARTAGQPVRLHVPLSRATIGDGPAVAAALSSLDANRAILPSLCLALSEADYRQMTETEKTTLEHLCRQGVDGALTGAASLRADLGELRGLGMRSIRVGAARFLGNPAQFSDLPIGEIAEHLRRFQIELVATGVADEPQLLALFESGVNFVQGPYLGKAGPVRPDLVVPHGAGPALRRVEK
ncbi:MAG TPA: EAL domain-containing protein [Devosia sp.]|nr:EAL domain-containing protein [Devosia sp.]